MKAKLTVNKNNVVDKIDSRIYGSFIEHLGRAVYEGIYEPTHKDSDDTGFRRDVIKYTRDLNVPVERKVTGDKISLKKHSWNMLVYKKD